jgi:TPR repeat protein/uncharacterized protein YecT (DUF1311 family)
MARLAMRLLGGLALVASMSVFASPAQFSRYADYLDFGDESRPHPHPLDEAVCRDCPGGDAYEYGAALLEGPGAQYGSDCAAALPHFLEAAAQGNIAAARALGFCYWYGNGVPHVRDEAIKWYRVAAAAGEPESSFRLGNLLLEKARSQDSGRTDPTLAREAEAWWQKAADAGHPRAMYALAKQRSDPIARFALMQQAANAGLADAQYAVARAYMDGVGVAQDEARARRLLERLDAEGRRIGDYFVRSEASAYIPCALAKPWVAPPPPQMTEAETQRLAAVGCESLHFGLGVARDDRAAFACYQAEQDYVQIAIMYANGYGTPRDLDAALHYACRGPAGAAAEHEGLVSRIDAARKGRRVEPYDFCDIATSGYSDALCADLESRLAAQATDDELARIADSLPEAARTTLERLRAAAQRLADLKASAQAPSAAGGHAAARQIEIAMAGRAEFLEDIARLRGRNWPQVGEAMLADADRALNLAYRSALKRCGNADDWRSMHYSDCGDVRAQERAWIAYRDLFARMAVQVASAGRNAAEVERAAQLELTRRQTTWLDSL